MRQKCNLIGEKFGRLTVLSRVPNDKNGRSMWYCKCDCESKAEFMKGLKHQLSI